MKFKNSFIEAMAYELPANVVSSEELEDRLKPLYSAIGLVPGQLETMTGIYERRYWDEGFNVAEGASRAAIKALEKSSISSDSLDVLVYAGVCRENFEPATACHVAANLMEKGFKLDDRLEIYDVSNACLGVMSAMIQIASRIELGHISSGMVVSCESAREIVDISIDKMNREKSLNVFKESFATLTGGSAAVAYILCSEDILSVKGHRISSAVNASAPQFHHLCRWGIETGFKEEPSRAVQFMSTDAVGVLENGVVLGEKTWDYFLKESGWLKEHIDKTVCHQVGSAHRKTILDIIGISPEDDFVAYDFLGNTGTVALPLAAVLADERGFLGEGHKVAFLGIGSGLNCLMMGLEW